MNGRLTPGDTSSMESGALAYNFAVHDLRDEVGSAVIAAQDLAPDRVIRLHLTDGDAHLLRMPISHLEVRWAAHGFIRIHRSYLVPVGQFAEFAVAGNNHSVKVSGQWLPVSRRHARDVRDRLLRAGRRH